MSSKFYKKVDSYYNDKKDDIQKKLDISKKYEYNFDPNSNIVEIILDNKIKLKAEYLIIGLYDIAISTWYWGWALDFVNKSLTKLDIIKNFPIILEKDKSDDFTPFELEELHFLTSNNVFYCSQSLEKVIRLSLFLLQGHWFFAHNNDGKIKYIVLTKIVQVY